MIRIKRLQLTDFRSYARLDVSSDAPLVALSGENGAGKTNILEALSLLAPGRGIRRAEFAEMARQGGSGGFAAAADIEGALGPARLGMGFEQTGDGTTTRICRIDRAPVGSAAAFADHLRFVWLTPDADGIFRGPPGDRRRFLDRLVLAVDASHAARVTALERALRARNRLLEDISADSRWLAATEREIAELAIAVVASRSETVSRLQSLIEAGRDDRSAFPSAEISLRGPVEDLLADAPAAIAEDRYRAVLQDSRDRDRAAGRALIGPQASDLLVRHAPKDLPAALASTGEQKALLVGLCLAHARLVADMSGIAPIVLLDEIAAHLDPRRRAALFAEVAQLAGQVWMTGADRAQFDGLASTAIRLAVASGNAVREV
jgi:DNA replication and repair protein RecF